MKKSEESESEEEPRCLLPPLTAVQMVWALTGLFSKERPIQNFYPFSKEKNSSAGSQGDEERNRKNPDNKENSTDTEEKKKGKEENEKEKTSKNGYFPFPTPLVGKALEDIRMCAGNDPAKNLYVDRVLAAMDASLRSLNTIYKGRNLNFDENTALRGAYLKSMKESIKYGFELKDLFKTLPTTTTVGVAVGGVLAKLSIPGDGFLPIIVISTALGFLIGWVLIRRKGQETQKLHIRQDFERKFYFCSYLRQVHKVLESLYEDVCLIYKDIYHEKYLEGKEEKKEEKDTITRMLAGMMPKICECAPRHLIEKKIKPELWTICETGNMNIIKENCKVWKEENKKKSKDEWLWLPPIPEKTSEPE